MSRPAARSSTLWASPRSRRRRPSPGTALLSSSTRALPWCAPPCTNPLLPVSSTRAGARPPARSLPVACTPLSNQAAVTGWAWTASGGPLFPGYISTSEGITFESLGRVGYAAWDATPENGKFQILGIIGILELLGEASVKPHYMSGGTPGKIPLLWDPLGFTAKLSPEALARKRNSELKNGWAAAPLPTRMHAPPLPEGLHPDQEREQGAQWLSARVPLAVQAPGDDWRCVARVRPLLPRLGPSAAGRHVSVQTTWC